MSFSQMLQLNARDSSADARLNWTNFYHHEHLASHLFALTKSLGEYITECSVDSAGSDIDTELLSNCADNMVTSMLELQMDINPATADALDEKKKKSACRKMFILNELIQTEKAYVRDLQECIDIYMSEMLTKEEEIPPGTTNVKHVIFGTILELYEFHHRICWNAVKKGKPNSRWPWM
ncbi:triple functional domain protein-like [Corythoichthys intestinalis]|uniref:triple functional domain protein-like n=1 Tax=Corythoichthys intestinalis TaxID=161448 RepID=UPI0025A55E44|nr:triple functional domain protein-like [Corythoichthys intestinalis]XP_057708904.1 triple functional domain protein-like [Corythoichthys intestinalis]